jgi:ubiquinone/menaquinone biosynthesis C-methylase UbiE
MDRDDPAYRGQSNYTRALLALYDPLVLGLAARFVWRCPTARLVAGYRQHIGARHLDVGPGTGYFLERAGLRARSPVTIVDPNANVLAHASRRLRT